MIGKPRQCIRSGWRAATAIALTLAMAFTWYAARSSAADANDYFYRAAQRDAATFDALDRNKDGRVTIDEVRGDIDWEARFDDFDINRDDVITREELARYVALRYGITVGAK